MYKLNSVKSETRDQIVNIHWIIDKARKFRKNICFIDYVKAFDCVENSSRDGNIRPPYLPPEKLAGQDATVRTGHESMDWFQIGKGVHRGCILSPCLFNLYAEYIMRNARLDESQVGIKISRKNINNLRYADDTTLMAESKEKSKSILMVKEESEKAGLKLNIQKTNIMHPVPSFMTNRRGKSGSSDRFYFLVLQNYCGL